MGAHAKRAPPILLMRAFFVLKKYDKIDDEKRTRNAIVSEFRAEREKGLKKTLKGISVKEGAGTHRLTRRKRRRMMELQNEIYTEEDENNIENGGEAHTGKRKGFLTSEQLQNKQMDIFHEQKVHARQAKRQKIQSEIDASTIAAGDKVKKYRRTAGSAGTLDIGSSFDSEVYGGKNYNKAGKNKSSDENNHSKTKRGYIDSEDILRESAYDFRGYTGKTLRRGAKKSHKAFKSKAKYRRK